MPTNRTKKSGGKEGSARPDPARKHLLSVRPRPKQQRPRASATGRPSSPRLVVGLGASAGGLEALEEFLEAMPPKSGMAFVVVTHQHAGRPSLMAELLQRKTGMPVVQLSAPRRIERDHVYTVRPGHQVQIRDGLLGTVPMKRKAQPAMPIDFFFRSLAHDQKERAVGIILSGTGTDGTLGLKEIKGELGMVMVQDEVTAQHAGMPHSAIGTQLVDYVLPAAHMPQQLMEYMRASIPQAKRGGSSEEPPETLQQIFVLVRARTGHDFSQYKQSTVRRRIERRIHVHRLDTVKAYVHYLQANPTEIDLLFKELFIGVTSFFRDAEAWEALSSALPELLADKPDDYVLRAWVPGCSTGEEAYSLAILLRECTQAMKRSMDIQVFGTDLDAEAIKIARAGVYPSGVTNDLSAKRLARFFTAEDGGYRVKKEIREMLVFAPQNLIADPPFTKVDILSCRNLLIYLDATLQKKLMPLFHYSLRPKGLLFLGSSESIGSFSELFSVEEKKWKIFRRQEVPNGTYVTDLPVPRAELELPSLATGGVLRGGTQATFGQIADRVLLRELVPPTVLVHERGDVVHILGRTGEFLEPAPGSQANTNIFNMAREGLHITLAAGMRQATAEDREVIYHGVQVRKNGSHGFVDVRIRRIREPEMLRGLFCITFEHSSTARHESASSPNPGAVELDPPDRLLELERELQYMKESHQTTIEELETANEELKSTNEEMQSTNEELQSTNEELETSKEEMQSLNEELQTVNAELQGKVEELSRANNDMKNLLNSTDIATVFLDNNLHIQRYTEQARTVIRLIPSDIGRSIADLVSMLQYDRLLEDAREVLRNLVPKEIEVRGQRGDAWYLMRILPYRTTENVIEGLVLTFVNITKMRRLQEEQRHLLETLSNSPTCMFGHDRELRYTWSYAFASVFGCESERLKGSTDVEVFGAKAARELVAFKRSVLETRAAARRRIGMTFGTKRCFYDVFVEPTRDTTGEITGLSCVATDVTPLTEPTKKPRG